MTDKTEVTFICSFCGENYTTEIEAPDGWKFDESYSIIGDVFCPNHAPIEEFAKEQCVGCVEGWGECSLFKAFAYHKFTLTIEDFAKLEEGTCPRRTNGTCASTGVGLVSIDFSSPAPEAGRALSSAIKNYRNKYSG